MNEIVSRDEAKARGLKFYFTGRPCKRGHVAERYVSSKGCADCVQENNRNYLPRRTNDGYKIWQRIRLQNSINRRIKSAERSKNRASQERRNRRARKRAAEGSHTADDIQNIFEAQNGKCAVCFIPLSKTRQPGYRVYHVDHMLPLSRGGSNWPSNLQLLCYKDNCSKGARTMEEWLGENWEEDVASGKYHHMKYEQIE